MGLDLRLNVVNMINRVTCSCEMEFERDYDLFDEIKKLPSTTGSDFYSNVVHITEDAYGKPITYVNAADFKKFASARLEKGIDEDLNKSIMVFLQSIPIHYKIFLYWN